MAIAGVTNVSSMCLHLHNALHKAYFKALDFLSSFLCFVSSAPSAEQTLEAHAIPHVLLPMREETSLIGKDAKLGPRTDCARGIVEVLSRRGDASPSPLRVSGGAGVCRHVALTRWCLQERRWLARRGPATPVYA